MSTFDDQNDDSQFLSQEAQTEDHLDGEITGEEEFQRSSHTVIDDEELQYLPQPTFDDEAADPTFDPENESRGQTRRLPVQKSSKGKDKAIDEPGPDLKDATPVHLDRPNRYVGPSSTWLTWTETERETANSLEQIRNRDLSIHLFNAHALQLRGRKAEKAESAALKIKPGMKFVPNKEWTAWPLPASEVPRGTYQTEYDEDDPFNYTSIRQLGSSEQLTECLIASTLRIAKARFDARPWIAEDVLGRKPSPDPMTVSDQRPVASDPEAVPMFSSQAFRDYDEGEEDESEEADGQIRASKETRKYQRKRLYDIDGSDLPLFMADDMVADDLILPSARETINQLDSLLDGLHKMRLGHRTHESQSPGDETSASESSSYWRKRKRRGTVKHSRRAQGLDSHDEQTGGRDLEVEKKSGSYRGPKQHRPAPRDWSDVLAVAAMTGWGEEVVARSAKRCANLFQEDMQFATLHEAQSRQEPSHIVKFTASGNDVMVEVTEASVSHPSNLENVGNTSESDGGLYICPNAFCRRHGRTFQSSQKLNAHMQQHHPASHSRSNRGNSTDLLVSEATTDPDNVVDYVCPVGTCRWHHRPFSRSNKMYDHVRRFHPEIDVNVVKRREIERRGEKRGRWNAARLKRSRSQSQSRGTGASSRRRLEQASDSADEEDLSNEY